MPTTLSPAETGFSTDRQVREPGSSRQGSFRGYLIGICIGVGATLAWQAYGEEAKRIIAPWFEQSSLSQVWRRGEPTEQMVTSKIQLPVSSSTGAQMADRPDGPQTATSLVPPAPSHDQQWLNGMASDLAALRLSVDQLATVRQTVGQLVAGQQQIARDIAAMQTAVQDIQSKMGAAPVRPAGRPRNPLPTVPSAPRPQ